MKALFFFLSLLTMLTTQAQESPTTQTNKTTSLWDDMILSTPGVRGSQSVSPQEKAYTTSSLTMTEARIAGELQGGKNRVPDSADQLLRRSLLEARGLLASNQVYQASRGFWAAHRISPGNEEAVEGLGICLLRAGDNSRAARLFEWLILRQPDQPAHRVNFAAALYQGGYYQAATHELQRLIQRHAAPEHILQYNLAMNLQAMGEVEAALQALDISAAAKPNDPSAWMAAARLCARQGQDDRMLDYLKKIRGITSANLYETFLENAALVTHRAAIRSAGLHKGRPPPPKGVQP